MALTENMETTKGNMAAAIADKLEELFGGDLDESTLEAMRDNWLQFGHAVAEILPPICEHMVANAEIGTVVSDVSGAVAAQSNSGKGLVR
jgi:hypothetical protein